MLDGSWYASAFWLERCVSGVSLVAISSPETSTAARKPPGNDSINSKLLLVSTSVHCSYGRSYQPTDLEMR